ncbi:MAG: hypothetical protein KIT84_28030 [Labilithrix sp.]|nr:hypothetical protein [Labilithrix sp.]MCW5814907.1 hypothetical protein [Labilithrix sp.]
MERGSFHRVLGLAGALFLLNGCGAHTQNVRAFRAYANEDPNVKVSIDRVEDVAVTLQLVDRILTGTSYTPGDMWPRRLGMTDAQFREVKDVLRKKYPYKDLDDVEIPILKCYRLHIERTMAEYGPPPEKGTYPSLLDAVGSLNPRDADIKKHWIAYRDAADRLADAVDEEDRVARELGGLPTAQQKARANELAITRDKVARAKGELLAATDDINRDSENLLADAQLASADKQQIARDAFYALSVAFRIELEALALIPIIVIQTVRGLPTAPRDLTFKTNLKIVRQVWQMPSYVIGIKNALTRQAELLDKMTSSLAKALATDVDESPGFELTESVVDQIVGITLDSFRVDLKTGGDVTIFTSIGEADRKGDNVDFRGRRFKLDYRVDPIILASARLDVVFDWIRLPGAANLAFGYSTDRVWKSGGSVTTSSFTEQLGITGVASDIIDAGLGLLGVRTSVRVADFTAGELRQVQATNVENAVASAPLKLKMTQIDVGYDLLWLIENEYIKAHTEEIVVGARYYQYTLPRIVYELQDDGGGRFTYRRETPAQPVESRFYMLGGNVRFGVGDAPRWSPYLDLGFYGGGGPTGFYFTPDPLLPDGPRDNAREAAFGLNGLGALGLRLRLLPRGSRVRLDLRAEYRGSLIYTIVNRDTTSPEGRALRTDFGQFDIFHGPSLSLRGAL